MGEVRVLTSQDVADVRRLLGARPIDNIQLASRVKMYGVDGFRLGNDLLGYVDKGQLVSCLSDGHSLNVVNATPAALDAFSRRLENRHCGSIIGVRDEAMGLWTRLCERSFTQWASPREVRDHQLVMALTTDPLVRGDPRVLVATTRYLDTYHAASVAMYTEEVGVAPADAQGAYRNHVATLMMRGLGFCALSQGRVIFKADIVASAGQICQIGGVWLDPALRGRGLSEPLMAAVAARCRERYSTLCLYVNSYNHPAVKCYRAIGFKQVSECATILY